MNIFYMSSYMVWVYFGTCLACALVEQITLCCINLPAIMITSSQPIV